jgi:cytochrome c
VKSGRISAIAVAALFVAARGALAQDPAAGEQVFQKCRPCHQIGEGARNLVGPVLNGVVGRPAGHTPASAIPTPTRTPASSGTRRRFRST